MTPPEKSTVEEIRARFDVDVERFSHLETGQTATMDAVAAMGMVTRAAALSSPHAATALDVGCGAGNFALSLRQSLPDVRVTLVDLSGPMLERARLRLGSSVEAAVQGDVRTLEFAPGSFDIIVAAAVLHHLRTPAEWEQVFRAFHRWLRPGGGLWVFDLVSHEGTAVQGLMQERYEAYLDALGGRSYRESVCAYIAKEDTPISLTRQIGLLAGAGFHAVDVLHKNACFAAFGALRGS